jgi:hypothetical protein
MTLGLSGTGVEASFPDGPEEVPPDSSKIWFFNPDQEALAEAIGLGLPGKDGDGSSVIMEQFGYQYRGIHWDRRSAQHVEYWVEDHVCDDFRLAIDTAFRTWERAANIDFDYAGSFAGIPSGYQDPGFADGLNEIAWISFDSADLPEFVALTKVWYEPETGLILEVDTAMNADLPWVQNHIGSTNPDEASVGKPDAFDVQAIATHEAGYWLGMECLCCVSRLAYEQTMQRYCVRGDLKKRTLETGDVMGAIAIYGEPSSVAP